MKIKVQLIIESENGDNSIVNQVADWQRDEPLQPSKAQDRDTCKKVQDRPQSLSRQGL